MHKSVWDFLLILYRQMLLLQIIENFFLYFQEYVVNILDNLEIIISSGKYILF